MAKKIHIWLSPKQGENKGKWEIFREGQPTGEIVTDALINKILTKSQYKEFITGTEFFYVNGERFRTRNHRPKQLRFSGKSRTI